MPGSVKVQREAVDRYGQPPGLIVIGRRGGDHLSPPTKGLGQSRLKGSLMFGPSAANPRALALLVERLNHRQPLVAPDVEGLMEQVIDTWIRSRRSDST